MQRVYRWQTDDGIGLEHLNLQQRHDVIVAEGVIIGVAPVTGDDGSFGCTYRICCDDHWRVRAVEVHTAGGGSCVLTTDGGGRWRDGDGRPIPELAGCLDVDISATPFTNTLPIRRLGEQLRQRTALNVAYISVPTLALAPAEQAYTRLAQRRYLYEGPVGSYQAEIEVDPDGLVVAYPALFRRLAPP
ncbi:putative glycolipid-binding domain-containing protein [Massilia sp. H6]|uniref:putative glycolipid-binding domain-containing protein n=1 Tax=Massilia sp. H6 TaxID=2970464 RepID=UPI0021696A51|nr:putative glycolipid-binding domain-containing protein [Massilia sp. H6]UVW27110.1 putative glycolipid-binding domain-containing protein [Massilia sp. H6]